MYVSSEAVRAHADAGQENRRRDAVSATATSMVASAEIPILKHRGGPETKA
jgi:hypothetical protein